MPLVVRFSHRFGRAGREPRLFLGCAFSVLQSERRPSVSYQLMNPGNFVTMTPKNGTAMSLREILTVLVAALALVCINAPLSRAYAAATDPFSDASPSFDKTPQDPTNYNTGEWGVAEQRGAATYTFPIGLPKGRNGMAPSLALRYSSRTPLRGGLAVGWTFEVPSIKVDRAVGVEQESAFRAELGKATGRLIRVPDKTPFGGVAYRVEFDEVLYAVLPRTTR